MAVDEAGHHVLALGVDHAVAGRQERLGPDGGDLVPRDGHGGLEDVGGGHDATAPDDGIDAANAHRWVSCSFMGRAVSVPTVIPHDAGIGKRSASAACRLRRPRPAACATRARHSCPRLAMKCARLTMSSALRGWAAIVMVPSRSEAVFALKPRSSLR